MIFERNANFLAFMAGTRRTGWLNSLLRWFGILIITTGTAIEMAAQRHEIG
jgi:hypothetical protein